MGKPIVTDNGDGTVSMPNSYYLKLKVAFERMEKNDQRRRERQKVYKKKKREGNIAE